MQDIYEKKRLKLLALIIMYDETTRPMRAWPTGEIESDDAGKNPDVGNTCVSTPNYILLASVYICTKLTDRMRAGG